MKGRKFVNDEDVIHTAIGWLDDQDQKCFYKVTKESGLWKNARPSSFLLERMCWKVSNSMCIFCCLTYEVFERPSYVCWSEEDMACQLTKGGVLCGSASRALKSRMSDSGKAASGHASASEVWHCHLEVITRLFSHQPIYQASASISARYRHSNLIYAELF